MTWDKAILKAMDDLGGRTRSVSNQEIIDYIEQPPPNNLRPLHLPKSKAGIVSKRLYALAQNKKVQRIQRGMWRLI